MRRKGLRHCLTAVSTCVTVLSVQFRSDCFLCLVALHTLGRCLLAKGDFQGAEELLQEALSMKRMACPEDKANIAMSKLLSCVTVRKV